MFANNIKPYPEYKPSGIEWLGDAPAHWENKRAKWLFRKMIRPVRKSDEIITCFRDGTVTLRKNRRESGFTEALKEIGYQGIRHGDLVIHSMDAFAGAIGVADSDGKGSPIYAVCKAGALANAHYYAHLLREMAHNQWIKALAKGIRERSSDFRYTDFGLQLLPLPPLHEQAAIARYLDHVDGRIQRYVRAKERLVELLSEYRRAVIERAVTRGLDPHVRLKPSGVEWLGDVPAHWEVRRLKYVATLIMGQSPPSSDCSDTPVGLPFLQGCAEFGTRHPSPVQFCRTPAKVSPAGAILMSVRAPVGRLNMADREYGIGRGLCAILPDNEILHTGIAQYQLEVLERGLLLASTGSTYDAVSIGDVASQPVILPPIDEQAAIADHLDGVTAGIDAAVSLARRQAELMREYRARLIADVVTGKIDVREAAAGLPAGADEQAGAL